MSTNTFAQNILKDLIDWQKELNTEYTDKYKSPLSEEDRVSFKGHSFYAIDTSYKVTAIIVLSKKTEEIPFATSTNKVVMHKEYGTLNFILKGNQYSLVAYQPINLMRTKEYADYLFLAFTDETTGTETYSGGRY